nr:hypothetical protein [Tanacetum cinerariifolium]
MRTRSQSRNNFPQQKASPVIVEPLRIELPFLEDQSQEDPPPEVLMADNRTMAELLQAPTEGYEFFEHDKEDPHVHIRYFNKITSTTRVPNVPSSSIKLMLFPFSLEGAARIWLEKEAPRSIQTWDDLVSKFINQFFPPSKTINLRNEIMRFQQRVDESFYEAWERFNDLLRACPHHGFSELHQLDTFYNALNINDQDSLNSAAGGNFLDKMPRECLKIIESKSKVRQSRAKAVVAKVSTSSSTPAMSSDVAELKDIVKALLLDRKNQSPAPTPSTTPAPVKAVEPNCNNQNNFDRGNNFNQNRGGNFNQSNFNPSSFNQGQLHQPRVNQAPVYQAPIPQTQRVSQIDFKSYVKANDAILRNMQSQGQSTQNQCQNIQNQYQNLQVQMATLTNMMSKLASSNTASSSGSGTLPGNTITNPKEELKGLTTRSGVTYQGPKTPSPSKQGTKLVVVPVGALMPNLKPSIPYPSRRANEKHRDQANEQIKKFYKIFKDMSFEISFTNAVTLMPKFASTLKALIRNKKKLNEMARTPMNEHCSAVILNKLPQKLGDPEKFLIPCEFPGMDECLALADLGASINLMPFSVWEALSLPELTPTCMTLKLADRSVSKPIGIAKDVSFKVGVFQFPADFVVVDFEPNPPSLLNSWEELKVCEAKTIKSSVDEPPEVELKDLPHHLEYAFLEGDNKLPVIIAKELGDEEKSALIKKEVEKLLDAGLIYPISDSPWVSPVHCVPKKGGFTVVENEENELIQTCLVTGWRVCIDYRKLNEATRKDHFPLPFMDQMLERLSGNEYYCFLYGFSGYFQILVDPRDQEKTTLTCPYGTFSYCRMPFCKCAMLRALFKGDAKAILPRWVLLLQEFNFKVLDTKGAENLAADHLSRLENPYENVLDPKEINETFPFETLSMVTFYGDYSAPWFADFANYHASNFIVK